MTVGQRLTYSARMDPTGCIELLLPRWEGNVMVHDSQFMSADDALALAKALTDAVAESQNSMHHISIDGCINEHFASLRRKWDNIFRVTE